VELQEVIQMMVGREINNLFPRTYCEPGDLALKVDGIKAGNKVKDVSLKLHYGEIVGLSGLVGSGRTETARAIFGLDSIESGSIELDGNAITHVTPPKAVDMGIGLVPEDRRRDGLFPILSMRQNLVMSALRQLFSRGFISLRKERKVSQTYVKSFDIQPPALDRFVKFLSGGNQQKVVLGKWLAAEPKVIIIDEPTRGIDVGTKSEVHALMNQLAHEGHAILMISSELPEILGMSDRIYVMHEGKVAGEFPRGVNSEEILRCAMGVN
jgi:ABC-type sugar transport system ATPase subunit